MPGFVEPLALLLLPLCLLPFITLGQPPIAYSSLAMLPPDPFSERCAVALKVLTALCIGALVLGIAGVYRAEETVTRIGQGAQMVMLIDSSGSMDRPFVTGNEKSSRAGVWGTYRSKGQIARALLAEYVAARKQDLFAMFAFSSNPIPVLPLTDKQTVVQAAIAAGAIERGLATTDLGAALIQSLEFFEGRAFTGSRTIMLVSDGGARLTVPVQDQIRHLLEKHRVTLYWIYLRDQFSPGLFNDVADGAVAEIAPEQLVHRFFSGMGLPYRAFSAENPAALENAIAAVDKLQNLPIRYDDIIPKRDLSPWCFGAALLLMGLLWMARIAEIDSWH